MRIPILILALVPAMQLRAQTPLPPVVQQGLDSLQLGRCQQTMDLWVASWPEMQKAQMAPTCSALQQYAGEYRGYEVLKTIDITPHLSRVYLVLLYSIQPVYLLLVLYRPGDTQWRVNTLNWNTDPDKVVPASIMPPQHPAP
jgi:hypothetical protein